MTFIIISTSPQMLTGSKPLLIFQQQFVFITFLRYTIPKDELAVQSYIYDVVKEQLNKRQMIDSVSRNTLRFLTAVCGYKEVRLLASQKIETWLQNPKVNLILVDYHFINYSIFLEISENRPVQKIE